MKKYLLSAVMLLTVLLSSCSGDADNSCSLPYDRFKIIHYPSVNIQILVDRDTRVMYISKCSSSAGFTVMVDADGKPMLYEGELD